MAKLDAYKFAGASRGRANKGGGNAVAQAAIASSLNANVKALGNIQVTLVGIDKTIKGMQSVANQSVKNDKLQERAERRRLQRERDAAREAEIEGNVLPASAAGMAKTGNVTQKEKSWVEKIGKALFGGLEGLLVGALSFVAGLMKYSAVTALLQMLGDENNRKQVETFLYKLKFVWEKISGFASWLVQDNLLDGFSSLFGENKTFQERLVGLGKVLIGIIGLKILLNPFGLLFGLLDLLNKRDRMGQAADAMDDGPAPGGPGGNNRRRRTGPGSGRGRSRVTGGSNRLSRLRSRMFGGRNLTRGTGGRPRPFGGRAKVTTNFSLNRNYPWRTRVRDIFRKRTYPNRLSRLNQSHARHIAGRAGPLDYARLRRNNFVNNRQALGGMARTTRNMAGDMATRLADRTRAALPQVRQNMGNMVRSTSQQAIRGAGNMIQNTPRNIFRGFKGLLRGGRAVISRVPVFGSLLYAAFDLLDVDEQGNLKFDMNRLPNTVYKTIGFALGTAVGSFVPPPFVGSILGGMVGEYGGDLVYQWTKGNLNGGQIAEKIKQDFLNTADGIKSGLQTAATFIGNVMGDWWKTLPKFPKVNWDQNFATKGAKGTLELLGPVGQQIVKILGEGGIPNIFQVMMNLGKHGVDFIQGFFKGGQDKPPAPTPVSNVPGRPVGQKATLNGKPVVWDGTSWVPANSQAAQAIGNPGGTDLTRNGGRVPPVNTGFQTGVKSDAPSGGAAAFNYILAMAQAAGGCKHPELVAARAMHESTWLSKSSRSVFNSTGRTNPYGQTGDRGFGTIPRSGDPNGWTLYPSVEKATQDHIALWHYTGKHKDNANAFDVPIDAIAASIGAYSPDKDPANQRKGYTEKAYIRSMVDILKGMGYDPYKSKSGAPTARPNSGNPQASPVSPKNPPNTNLSSRIQIGGDGAPITSAYGYRTHPVTGEVNKLHGGIDIGVPSGTFISLTEPGVVVAAGQYGGYGNLVDIWVPGKGIQLRFAHLSQILTQTGAKVPAYTAIARSGGGANDKGRGSSTGPHIHFEADTQKGAARYGGSGNPKPYISLVYLSNNPPDGHSGSATGQTKDGPRQGGTTAPPSGSTIGPGGARSVPGSAYDPTGGGGSTAYRPSDLADGSSGTRTGQQQKEMTPMDQYGSTFLERILNFDWSKEGRARYMDELRDYYDPRKQLTTENVNRNYYAGNNLSIQDGLDIMFAKIADNQKGKPKAFLGKVFKSIGKAVSGVFKGISKAVSGIAKGISGFLNSPIGNILTIGVSLIPGVGQVVGPILQAVKAVDALARGDIMGAMISGFGAAGGFFPGTFGAEGTFWAGLNKGLGDGLGGIAKGFLTGGFGGALGALPGLLPAGLQTMLSGVQGFFADNPMVGEALAGVAGAMGFGGMMGMTDQPGQPGMGGAMGELMDVAMQVGAQSLISILGGQGGSFEQAIPELAAIFGVKPETLGGINRTRAKDPMDAKSREYALQTSLEPVGVPLVIEKLVAIPKVIPIVAPVPMKGGSQAQSPSQLAG